MDTKDRKFTLTISVNGEDFDRLTKLSIVRGVNRSAVVRQMIEDYWNKAVKKGTL